MEIIQKELLDIDLHLPLKSSVVVVGYFDGLHWYHQKLLNIAQKIAVNQNLKFILVTFSQKVGDYLHKTNNDLISSEVKQEFLKVNYQIDYLVELKVNQDLVNLSKQKFLDFLEQKLGTKMMVEGEDFCFGAQCTGKINDLIKRFGAKQIVILKRKKAVSATKIRLWLTKGKILKINFWLRRRLELSLKVTNSTLNSANYQLIYPKTKLKPGLYEIDNQNHQVLIIEVNEKQKIKVLSEQKVFPQDGLYQFQFKKFLGVKK